MGGENHGHGHNHGHDAHDHHHHEHHDHNRRAAYFHVLADALTSVLAIGALLAGKYAGWNWMDPTMDIVGAVLITRWSWLLLKDTSSVLLDQQCSDLEEDVRRSIENDNARISDLHLWVIGPNIHAAIVSIVSHDPESPGVYKQRIQDQCLSLVHVTVEIQRCIDDPKADAKARFAS
ncbi:cation transporter [Pistricoccus aurantiacus]|uniref:cation transporter n=1 Tax=Pistricoccus aurantiacus TaxID=1883414 RepID=UPI001FE89AF0|nr:cation transporter [Pistricoccus aurantiacus]